MHFLNRASYDVGDVDEGKRVELGVPHTVNCWFGNSLWIQFSTGTAITHKLVPSLLSVFLLMN
jgi:hypothetical protein